MIDIIEKKMLDMQDSIASDILWRYRCTYTGERCFWLPRIAEWVLPSDLALGPEFTPEYIYGDRAVSVKSLGGFTTISMRELSQ